VPQKVGHRQRDDIVLRTVKVVAAVIMDQLHEHAKLSRSDAAKEIAKVFSQYGLRNFQGRAISATAVMKWRDQAKEAKDPELAREFNRVRSIDTEALRRDAPLGNKRDFLLCMSSEHFGQLAWQFKRMSGSSGLKVQAAIAC
jgi:hypothetical protein